MQDTTITKPKKKRRWLPFVFVGINVAVIVIMAISEFGNQDSQSKPFSEVARLLGEHWYFILFALAAFLAVIACETFKYFTLIRACTGKRMLRESFEVAVLGKYYDFITPSGTGGQPFQMYHLKKSGLSAGISGSLPIMGFFTNQMSFIVVAAVLFVWRSAAIETAAAMKVAAIFGLVCYSLVPMIFVFFSIFPKPTRVIVSGVLRFCSKIHIVKNYDATVNKVFAYFEEYRVNLFFLAKEKFSFIMAFVFSLIAQIANASVPFLVLNACGSQAVWIDTVALSFYVYAAVTYIPTPGNMGVAEGAFYIIFQALSGGVLFWGTLIWRFFTYYMYIILGLVTVAITTFKAKASCQSVENVHIAQNNAEDASAPDNTKENDQRQGG